LIVVRINHCWCFSSWSHAILG